MNTETLVAETLNGLPASIEVVIPWSPELEMIAWWETSEEFTYEFPTAFHSTTDCERFIARTTIETLEAVLEGNMNLPSCIDTACPATFHRDGRVDIEIDRFVPATMLDLVKERCCTTPFDDADIFNREFAQYYAGLVAQQRERQ